MEQSNKKNIKNLKQWQKSNDQKDDTKIYQKKDIKKQWQK